MKDLDRRSCPATCWASGFCRRPSKAGSTAALESCHLKSTAGASAIPLAARMPKKMRYEFELPRNGCASSPVSAERNAQRAGVVTSPAPSDTIGVDRAGPHGLAQQAGRSAIEGGIRAAGWKPKNDGHLRVQENESQANKPGILVWAKATVRSLIELRSVNPVKRSSLAGLTPQDMHRCAKRCSKPNDRPSSCGLRDCRRALLTGLSTEAGDNLLSIDARFGHSARG